MTRRILAAVTLRRVVVALLIGAFAKEILTVAGWLAMVRLSPAAEANGRAFLRAALGFALDAALIYLVLHGLGAVLGRGRRRQEALTAEERAREEHHRRSTFEEYEAHEAAGSEGTSGGDGHGPDLA